MVLKYLDEHNGIHYTTYMNNSFPDHDTATMRPIFAQLLKGTEPSFQHPSRYSDWWYDRDPWGEVRSSITDQPWAALAALRWLPLPHRRSMLLVVDERPEEGTSTFGYRPRGWPEELAELGCGRPGLCIQASNQADQVFTAWVRAGQTHDVDAVRIVLEKIRGGGDLGSLRSVLVALLPAEAGIGWTVYTPGRSSGLALAGCVPSGVHTKPDDSPGSVTITHAAKEIIEAWTHCLSASPTPSEVAEKMAEKQEAKRVRKTEEAVARDTSDDEDEIPF